MKIICQSCESKYTVSDEKLQGKTVKIKCRKCGATIVVNSSGVTMANGAPAASEGAPPSAGANEPTYSVNVGENDQRTMTVSEIVAAYNQSVVAGETFVWTDGMADWAPLANVEAIVVALNAWAGGPAAAADPVAEAPRAAVRRESARRDLFGGGAGVDAAPPAAAASAPDPLAFQPLPENSVLFSLSALTAQAASPASPSRSKTGATTEDSGLIDLRALSERAAASGTASAPSATAMMDDGPGLFPLGAPMLAGAPVLAAPSVPPPVPSKAPMFIGLGVAVAGLAVAGAFVFLRPKPLPPPEPLPASTAQAAVNAAPSSDASAAPTAADPGGVASAAPAASAVAKGGPAGKLGRGKLPDKGSSAPAGATAEPAAAKPPPAAKSKCNCPPGDLMCNIKCSAGK